LAAGESARLDFKPSEMNDVLKSLTVSEKGGGKISGLRYDSSIPLDEKLSDFPFKIEPGQPLSAVLDQLKGARVEIQFGSEKVSGSILGARNVPSDEKRPEREQITLLLDSGELRTFDLAAATGIRFSDPKLQQQLKEYLSALTGARSKDKRSVYIESTDAKTREVSASYVIPTPIWKSSYRLIFDAAAQPTLEGWAIVDNTTGEDWTKVRMSLVSGKPISFISALYEPRFVTRPTAELPEERAQAPVIHGGAVDAENQAPRRGIMGGIAGGLPSAAPPAAKQMPGTFFSRAEVAPSSIVDAASGQAVGELFEYRVATPVTIRKNESAMLPFLQQKIDARKLLIYSDPGSQHPLNAAELTNATGKTLDGGPITVFDAGAYAGEALVETVKTGDKRLISYAVDLGTRITTNLESKSDIVREIHVNRGILTARVAGVETKTYTARNVDSKAKTLIVEHAVRPQYRLLNQKPLETTAGAYRFEVKLPPGATEKFPVTEERVYSNSFSLTNVTPDLLLTYVQNRELSASARQQLQHILDLKNQIAATDTDSKRVEAQAATLIRDQERTRQNIASLNQVSGQQQQVQTYAARLAQQESELATLRDREAELQKKKAALEAELNAAIQKLDF
ncbi:MAG: DUF4139 domain-containing protein, partial [Acidobacteriota bacterium]|nr:DUF4139 domain-containing protein [Acidobacteriota bacterium]